MTVTEMLARARLRLVRLEPRQAMETWRAGALLVDIRPQAQRQQEGEIPGALLIERNVLEWRLDPGSDWRVIEATEEEQEPRAKAATRPSLAGSSSKGPSPAHRPPRHGSVTRRFL